MISFTVFTSVFNGGSTLNRVYHSLLRQTYSDFEWLIIDDGSTDNTADVISDMIRESKISIRFYRQENMHKFYSLLKGIEYANGKYFLIADADDEFREDTLSLFHQTYVTIPNHENDKILGVNCLCQDSAGRIVGDLFPRDGMISDHNEMYYRYRVRGEKWGMQLTSVLKQFSFPKEFFNNGYIPEGILWSRIAEAGYKIVFINEPLRIYYNDNNRISISTGGKDNLKRNSFGSMHSTRSELNNHLKYFVYRPLHFVKTAILYYESAKLQELNSKEAAKGLNGLAKMMYWTLYPLSVLVSRKRNSAPQKRM